MSLSSVLPSNTALNITSEEQRLDRMRMLIKEEMKQNYDLVLFSILPELDPGFSNLMRNARKLGIEPEEAESYMSKMLEAKLWVMDANQIKPNFDLIDLGDISVKDYLSMTVGIISRLSESKSHSYDTLTLATNRQLVRQFVGKVNQGLKELYNASQVLESPKECIFSWSHTGVIELELKNKAKKSLEEMNS